MILVDPLKALRVLHSHEEFLSQVLEWLVGGQIQTVKTEGWLRKHDMSGIQYVQKLDKVTSLS